MLWEVWHVYKSYFSVHVGYRIVIKYLNCSASALRYCWKWNFNGKELIGNSDFVCMPCICHLEDYMHGCEILILEKWRQIIDVKEFEIVYDVVTWLYQHFKYMKYVESANREIVSAEGQWR